MNYEIAKKLKDAGYSQKIKMGILFPYATDDTREKVYMPTLSELIEACDGKMTALISTSELNGRIPGDKEWIVTSRFLADQKGLSKSFKGDTMEEVVALLWFELNKKPFT